MATSFDNVLISVFYSAVARGGPEWATAVVRSGQGGAIAHRNINREDFISRYEIDYQDLTPERKSALRSFSILRQGMARAFRFLAPDDSALASEIVGFYNQLTGDISRLISTDGTIKEFFVIKTYSDNTNTYIRRIVKPSPLDDWTMEIFAAADQTNPLASDTFPGDAGGVLPSQKTLSLGGAFGDVVLDYDLGKLIFAAPPPAGFVIKLSGVYHLPVAFTEDWQKYQIDDGGTSEITVQLEEILPAEIGIFAAGVTNITLHSVSVSAPLQNAVISNNFNFAAAASPGTESVKFYLDGVKIGEKTSAPFELPVNSNSFTNGTHLLRLSATKNGNLVFSQTISVNFQNLAVPVLSGAKLNSSAISLNWTQIAGATGYKLWRDGFVLDVGNVLNTIIGSLPPGTHNFKVLAYSQTKESSYSNQVSIALTAYTPPSAPTNFAASPNSTTALTAAWSASMAGDFPVAGYRLWRDGFVLDVGNVTQVTVGSLPAGSTHNLKVLAYDADNNESSYSAQVSVTLPGIAPPAVPLNFAATESAPDAVTASWTASMAGDFPVANYKLWRDGFVLDVGNVTQVTVGSLPPGTYNFKIRAVDTQGNLSAYSAVQTITLAGSGGNVPTNFTAEII